MHPIRTFPLLALPIAAVTLAACGSGGSSSTSTPTATTTAAAAAAAPSAVTVTAKDFGFSPDALTAKAGKVRFTLDNTGKAVHELVVLKTSAAPDKLKVTGGRVSEKDAVGEVSETPAGQRKSATIALEPGTYVFVCNVPSHYMLGMRGTLTVK